MVILGLGSNHGDRKQFLQRAIDALKDTISDVHCSPVYETHALLPAGAPAEWNIAYLNMALCGETAMSPQALLKEIKIIEHTIGRIPRGHWGPREIDIDILAYDNRVINENDLVIPHKELLSRDFALIPLADIAPFWIYPVKNDQAGKTAAELKNRINCTIRKTDIIIQ